MADLRLSINLTPRDLDRPGYEQWLLAEVAAAGLAPDQSLWKSSKAAW